ncbi:N-methylhydantoinase A/oxoprolinase/acetone carboxylase beta subunit [Rhodoligotrophos appendicifer]|uniref:hydantoinase/oxoprolinase family protein n=1 Tax=Rhodoligotrophos appendicifer TaxID=987056 RepID=UPI00117C9C26|nr:hydantoinase/oxoprolinase family protein [Rhodoligotrophos appendicifer]
MALLLGVDTGGTYTDAVIFDDAAETRSAGVVAKAKALTTRRDLVVGIAGAVDKVLARSGAAAADISLVSLSTTLATNALVEGQGGRVCLVFIGFGEQDLARAGLKEALGDDPVILLAGGHDPLGEVQAPLDVATLEARLDDVGTTVTGFAVAAHFATRNPDHELKAADIIRSRSGLPVTCSHELSAKLNGPKRALTCVLNARLISMIHHLIAATEGLLQARGIHAPLMVVRGDGALISADYAKLRPIETILSGPAASLVGAAYLTHAPDAIVSDIGGTTTDIAVMIDGQPRIDPSGALVGGWRTMVEAVAMYTHGLGGDSEVSLDADNAYAGTMKLGPRRVVPLSLLAISHAAQVHAALDRQLDQSRAQEFDGRFALVSTNMLSGLSGLGERERILLEQIGETAAPLDRLIQRRPDVAALNRLVTQGIVSLSGLTPSDASHVLGIQEGWDAEAARKGAALFALKKNGQGNLIWPTPAAVARSVIDTLTRRSAELLLDAGFAEDGFQEPHLSRSALARAWLDRRQGQVSVQMRLTTPVIGLGASSPVYYPAIAELLGADLLVPEHADVANAVGAVVGNVKIRREVMVSEPVDGQFRVHVAHAPKTFTSLEEAVTYAESMARDWAHREALEAGAAEVSVRVERNIEIVTIEGQQKFVDGSVTAVATGRPRMARETVAA